MTFPTISEAMIRQNLDEATSARGQLTQRQGKVHQLKLDDDIITAVVDDDRHEQHSVMIRWQENLPKGNCSCPTAFNCRHIAATLYAAMQQQHQPQNESLETTEETTTEETAPPSPFSAWLGALDHNKAISRKKNTSTGQCIIYLLKKDEKHGLIVSFHSTRRLKNGNYGQLQGYQPANAIKANAPTWLETADIRILRMVASDQAASLRRYYQLRGEDDVSLLKQLLTTGRCYWNTPHGTALRLGDALPGQWQWHINQRGEQRLDLLPNVPGLLLIPVSPPWYLDTIQGQCGRITPPAGDHDIDRLLHLPTLSPDCSEEERTAIIQQLPVGIPQPWKLTYRSINTQVQAVVELHTVPTPDIYQGILPPHIHLAELWLEYEGGQRHPWVSDQQAMLRMVEQQTITDYRRDFSVEQRALTLLHRYDLHNQVPWLQQAPLQAHQFTLMESRQWPQWLVEKQPQLAAEEGIKVIFHPSFRHQLASVDHWLLETKGDGWFGQAQLRVQLDDGDQIDLNEAIAAWVEEHPDCLKAEELEELRLQAAIALPLPHGQILSVPGDMLANILYYMQRVFAQQPLAVTQLATLRRRLQEQQVQVSPDPWLEKATALLQPDICENIAPPAGLRAQLRDYQQQCLNWLQMLARIGMHGILADDMGLGKTLQAISHILTEKEAGRLRQPALVICPTSLVHNWASETRRFAPALSVLILHGQSRNLHFPDIASADLVISTYPLLIRDFDVLQAQHWHIIVLDEAQYIKNPNARSSQLIRQLEANHRLCMTGTPLENHLGDLWSQFDFLMPGYLGSHKQFRRIFQLPIEHDGDEQRQALLNQRIQPFILRRCKEDVATELPKKTEIIRRVDMEGSQRELYEAVRLSMQKRVHEAISRAGFNKSHIVMLSALLRLRQVCCDPRLLPNYHDHHSRSAKLDMLRDMLPEMLEEGRRILLFSQFTSMLTLIEEAVQEMNIPYVKLTGKSKNRPQLIERFQSGDVPLFLVSLKAGGTGLNLTAADTVIHYDPWWNPAAEQQATDRAHRIGQDKPVFVYKLITEGSVEEKILNLQQRKQLLADQLHKAAETDMQSLSEADIQQLFTPLE